MEALIFLNILIRSKSLEIASNFVEDIESGLFFPNKRVFFIPRVRTFHLQLSRTRPYTKLEAQNPLGVIKVNRIAKMNKKEYS